MGRASVSVARVSLPLFDEREQETTDARQVGLRVRERSVKELPQVHALGSYSVVATNVLEHEVVESASVGVFSGVPFGDVLREPALHLTHSLLRFARRL